MTKEVLAQYLACYAEPEARGYTLDGRRYSRALVIPVFRESVQFLDGMRPALQSISEPALVIVVVNSSSAAADTEREHQRLLGALTSRSERLVRSSETVAPAWLGPLDDQSHHRMLVIDRASAPWLLPRRQGVGLARKIGFDLACACYARGQLRSPWIYSTDADARLAAGHFDAEPTQPGALVFPFMHLPSEDESLDVATWAYECSLRYHVLGLRFANSPYAWHALGSAMAVHAHAYARVRGFPKRAAAEDFYLLEKVAQTAPVHRASSPVVGIMARCSERVPVGTGPAVARLLQGNSLIVEAPAAYQALLDLGRAVERAATCGRPLMAELHHHAALRREAERLGLVHGLRRILDTTRSPQAALRRWSGWFDGLKTRQLLRALRSAHPPLRLQRALREATFLPNAIHALSHGLELQRAEAETWWRLRGELSALESELDRVAM